MSIADAAAAPDASAASDRPKAALLLTRFGWVALLVALDLWSKARVFAWLTPLRDNGDLPMHHCGLMGHPRYPVFGGWFGLMLSNNHGAAFGKFGDMPYLLVGGRIGAILFVSWLLIRATPRKPWVAAAFILILSGALGNVYDNLFLIEPGSGHPFGAVRDFIDVYFGFLDYHFATFNVADSCITVGAMVLVLNGLFSGRKKPAPSPAA